jgi:hypothetical protein
VKEVKTKTQKTIFLPGLKAMKSLTRTRTQHIGKMASENSKKPRKPHCVFSFFCYVSTVVRENNKT